jgi:hypothetical protein
MTAHTHIERDEHLTKNERTSLCPSSTGLPRLLGLMFIASRGRGAGR